MPEHLAGVDPLWELPIRSGLRNRRASWRVCRCKCLETSFRSNLHGWFGQGYDPPEMRSISCLALAILALGCASQSSNTERQLREQEERLKRLTATCDRLEERVLALESSRKTSGPYPRVNASADGSRPELPTVKLTPETPTAERDANSDASFGTSEDDTRRVVIVGEGARVEARSEGESSSLVGAKPTGKANSRASKTNQGSLPKASTSGAPQ